MGELETFHVDPSNKEQSQAWDGDEGAYWAAHAERFDTSVGEYHRRLMDRAAIEPDWHVLDIGCGSCGEAAIIASARGRTQRDGQALRAAASASISACVAGFGTLPPPPSNTTDHWPSSPCTQVEMKRPMR